MAYFVMFAIAANVIFAAYISVYVGKFFGATCVKPLNIYLIICIVLYILNIAFAIFVCTKFARNRQEQQENAAEAQPLANDRQAHIERSRVEFNKLWRFFMYDPIVFVYILVIGGEIAWAIVGFVWIGASTAGGACTYDILVGAQAGYAMIIIWVVVGCTCVCCSICLKYLPYLFYVEMPWLQCCCCCILPCIEPRGQSPYNQQQQQQQQHEHQQQQPLQQAMPVQAIHVQEYRPPGQPQYPASAYAPQQAMPVAQPAYQACQQPPAYQPAQSAWGGQPAPQPGIQVAQPVGEAYAPSQPKSTEQKLVEGAGKAAHVAGDLAAKGLGAAKGALFGKK